MKNIRYDPEADAFYVDLSPKHSKDSRFVGPNIVIDVDSDENVVGVEILEARHVMSDVFGHKISKENLSRLKVKPTLNGLVSLTFHLDGEHATLALPKPERELNVA